MTDDYGYMLRFYRKGNDGKLYSPYFKSKNLLATHAIDNEYTDTLDDNPDRYSKYSRQFIVSKGPDGIIREDSNVCLPHLGYSGIGLFDPRYTRNSLMLSPELSNYSDAQAGAIFDTLLNRTNKYDRYKYDDVFLLEKENRDKQPWHRLYKELGIYTHNLIDSGIDPRDLSLMLVQVPTESLITADDQGTKYNGQRDSVNELVSKTIVPIADIDLFSIAKGKIDTGNDTDNEEEAHERMLKALKVPDNKVLSDEQYKQVYTDAEKDYAALLKQRNITNSLIHGVM